MKRLFTFSTALRPLLALIIFLITTAAMADSSVTTAAGATWTCGTDQGASVWYWDGSTDKDSRSMANRSSEMCDGANYDGHGWEVVAPGKGRISQAQASAAARYRVFMQQVKYSISVPAYASVQCAYTLNGKISERTSTSQYKGLEIFDWGATDHTLTQTINTHNSGSSKSGDNDNETNYLKAGSRNYGSSAVTITCNVSWSSDNKTGTSSKTFTEYLAVAGFSRKGAITRGLDAYVAYANESVTYTYYNQLQYDPNGGTGTFSASDLATSNTVISGTPTRSGYTFNGWNTKADGSGTAYTAGQTITATSTLKGPITLYAQWAEANYILVVHNNNTQATICGDPSEARFTMTYGATTNNSLNTSQFTSNKYAYVNITDADGVEVFDGSGKCIRGTKYFDANGRWIWPDHLHVQVMWKGRTTTLTLNASPGTVLDGQTQGSITLIQESAQHYSDGNLNPFYAGYVFTGGYTAKNGGGYRVYRDGSRATTDGNYWKDSGLTGADGLPVLYWDRGDLNVLTLYANWVEAYYYFEVADGLWQTQGCWKEYDAGEGQTGLLKAHQPADCLPQSFNNVIISHTVHIESEVSCKSLTILPGGVVVISPTGGLTVGAGGISGATKDNFIIESTTTHQGYFRMSPEATTPMPEATIQLATRSTLDSGTGNDAVWQYIGVPCATDFTCDGQTLLHQWSTSAGWVNLSDGAMHTLAPWQGYCITQPGQQTYEFTGQLQGGNQVITLSGEAATQGMNLIANSYSAPIDVKNFIGQDFSNASITKTLYIYNTGSWNQWNDNQNGQPSTTDHTPGTYTEIPVITAVYLEGEQTLVAPMQAIMIQLTQPGTPTITFNYERLIWNAQAHHGSIMTDPLRAPLRNQDQSDELTARIRLRVQSNNSGSDHLYLLEKSDFTPDYDNGCDAPKLPTAGLANIYAPIAEGMLAVCASNRLDSTCVGFAAGVDSLYTLTADALCGAAFNLLDCATGIITPLAADASYTFSATPGSCDDHRFLLLRNITGTTTTTTTTTTTGGHKQSCYYSLSGQRMGDSYNQLPAGIYIRQSGNQSKQIVIK